MKQTLTAEAVFYVIKEMLYKDFEFFIGKHTKGMTGYWADFTPPERYECEECGRRTDSSWGECGHHKTVAGAIAMAREVALGLPCEIPDSETFEQ